MHIDVSTAVPVVVEVVFSTKPWDGSPSRFSDDELLASIPKAMAAWARSQAKESGKSVRQFCHLPIREPDGAVNVRALANAKARANQVEGCPEEVLTASLEEINALQAEYRKKADSENCATVFAPGELRGLLGVVECARVRRLVRESCILIPMPATEQAPVPGAQVNATGDLAKVQIIQAGVSKNMNLWRTEVLGPSVPKFEGAKVYYDHRDDNERGVRDLVGRLEGVHMEGDKMVGNLRAHKGATFYRDVVTSMPDLIGLSVYVYAYSVPDKDDKTIEDIQEIAAVRSVDVVDNPAAGGGIVSVLECGSSPPQRDKEDPVEKEKLKEMEEALAKSQADLAVAAKELADSKAEIAKAKAENAALSGELATLRRRDLVTARLAEARKAQKIGAELENTIRESVAALTGEVNVAAVDAVVSGWVSKANALAKEIAPEPPAIPPAIAQPATAPAPAGPSVRERANAVINGYFDTVKRA